MKIAFIISGAIILFVFIAVCALKVATTKYIYDNDLESQK